MHSVSLRQNGSIHSVEILLTQHPATLGAAGGPKEPGVLAWRKKKADYIQHPRKHFPVADETLLRLGRPWCSTPEQEWEVPTTFLSLKYNHQGGHQWGFKMPGANHWAMSKSEQWWHFYPSPSPVYKCQLLCHHSVFVLSGSQKILTCMSLWHMHIFSLYCFVLLLENSHWQGDNDLFVPTLILLCSCVFDYYY